MEHLIRRVQAIAVKTGSKDNKDQLVAEGETADEFTILKRQINLKIRECRNSIQQRDDFKSKSSAKDAPEVVRQTTLIRNQVKELRELSSNLRDIFSKEYNKSQNKSAESLTIRQRMCDLIDAHIDEVDNWAKAKGFVSIKDDPSKRALLKGSNLDDSAKPQLIEFTPSPNETELEDIDGIDEWRLQIKENEQQIDNKLDLVLEGTYRVRQLANTLQEEYKILGTMVDDVDNTMNKTNSTMVTTTDKTKEALDKMTGGNCCIDFFLVIILIACIYYMIQRYITF